MIENNKAKVCIIIPLYKGFDQLNDFEITSLKQCFIILNSYEFYFIGPKDLNFNFYITFAKKYNVNIQLKVFPSKYFNNIKGYNKLMLSTIFYISFQNFKYILIYQTDAWVFRDELELWCEKGYDYVGAPWIDWPWSTFAAAHLTLPRTFLNKIGYNQFNLVGNGGFSLRKVSSCINNLKIFKKEASNCDYNEDYFFSFYITTYNPFFKIPKVKEALKFAFDENPAISYEQNKKQLPMGCHGWPKYKDFWEPFIEL